MFATVKPPLPRVSFGLSTTRMDTSPFGGTDPSLENVTGVVPTTSPATDSPPAVPVPGDTVTCSEPLPCAT